MNKENPCSNEKRFTVSPSVVRADTETEITIKNINNGFDLGDGVSYVVHYTPKDNRYIDSPKVLSLFGYEELCDKYEVTSQNGVLKLKHFFRGEQEWIISIARKDDCDADWWWTDSFPNTRVRLSVYALSDDLYGKIPLKGDLHIHTSRSDGDGSPEEVAAEYRKAGYDFLAFTDHRVYNDAKEVNEYFSFADTIKCISGEEVHDDSGYIHMVSLGGKYCVSDFFKKDSKGFEERLKNALDGCMVPQNVNTTEYAYRKVIYEEIKKSGGYAIYPHPMWQVPERFNAEVCAAYAVLKDGLTDAFELVGGCTPEGNNLQINLWNDLRAEGINYPVVGSSDSHSREGENTTFKEQYTICFAESGEDIIRVISLGRSIAAEAYNGENIRFYGNFRYVKYAHFLRRCYFHRHHQLCEIAGDLLKKHVNGDKSVREEVVEAENKINNFKKEFFGL